MKSKFRSSVLAKIKFLRKSKYCKKNIWSQTYYNEMFERLFRQFTRYVCIWLAYREFIPREPPMDTLCKQHKCLIMHNLFMCFSLHINYAHWRGGWCHIHYYYYLMSIHEQYWILIGWQLIMNLRITIDSRRVTNITYFTLEIWLFKDLQDLTEGNMVIILRQLSRLRKP